MRTFRLHHIAVIGLLALTAACTPKPPPGPPPSGVIDEGLVTATATVKKIDHKTRTAVLQMPDGHLETITVSDKVQNLSQVKVGDTVSVSYYESLAFQVMRPGTATPGVTAASDAERAAPGQRPGAAGARVITVTTTIKAIDKKAGTVTLAGLNGEPDVTVKAQDPTNLDRVAVGELVAITMTQALAVAVEPPTK
jgi:Cu/Ag efflux protein CusF